MRALAGSNKPMGVSELSQTLGFGKSTVHTLLTTLLHEDFVERAPGSLKYRLGLGLFELGAAAVEQIGYGLKLSPVMERLAAESGEAVSLAVQNRDSVVFVQRFESVHVLRTDIRPGTRLPLFASASGRVLLAGMSDDEIREIFPSEDLPPVSGAVLRTVSELKDELARVRENGWGMSSDEYVTGVSAIAAPVRDRTGRVVAALSIAGPTMRFDAHAWLDRLLEVASEISRLLGYYPIKSLTGLAK